MAFSLIGRISPCPLVLLLLSCEVTKAGWLSLELRHFWVKPNAHFPPFPFRARSMKKIRNASFFLRAHTCELKIQIKFYGYPFALREVFCFDFWRMVGWLFSRKREWLKVVKSWLKVLGQASIDIPRKLLSKLCSRPSYLLPSKNVVGKQGWPHP